MVLFIFQFHSSCSSMGKCAVHFRLMGLIEITFWFRSVISECNTSVIHNSGCLFIHFARCFSAMKDMFFSLWFAQRLFPKRIYPFGMVRKFGQTNQFSELWKKRIKLLASWCSVSISYKGCNDGLISIMCDRFARYYECVWNWRDKHRIIDYC